MPEISVNTLELLNSLVALRYIVGGATIIDNDSWQFADSEKRAPSPQKKSRWSVLREATPSTLESMIESGPASAPLSARDRIKSIKSAALNLSREAKKDDSIPSAQDPVVRSLLNLFVYLFYKNCCIHDWSVNYSFII